MFQKPLPTDHSKVARDAFLCVLAAACFTGGFAADARRALEFDDLLRAQRLSDPQISPDGKSVAYVITRSDKVENKTDSD
ncbi:MAG: hypothetical protein DME18_04000, partial [Verrucomicrobia bacterium]